MTTIIKASGTKVTAKITPDKIEDKLNNCRPMDNEDGSKGKHNKPHAHVNLFKWFRNIQVNKIIEEYENDN